MTPLPEWTPDALTERIRFFIPLLNHLYVYI